MTPSLTIPKLASAPASNANFVSSTAFSWNACLMISEMSLFSQLSKTQQRAK